MGLSYFFFNDCIWDKKILNGTSLMLIIIKTKRKDEAHKFPKHNSQWNAAAPWAWRADDKTVRPSAVGLAAEEADAALCRLKASTGNQA